MGPGAHTRVLVAYASEQDSTRGVAQQIAARLREHNHDVELRPVGQVDHVEAFDGFIDRHEWPLWSYHSADQLPRSEGP